MNYVITGKVVAGDKYARKLGFPTVNLETKIKDLDPGVYTGKGILNKKIYRAGIVVNEAGRAEAHLLGYRGDAYEKLVTLEIKKFIRKYEKFEKENELIAQIRKDLKMC